MTAFVLQIHISNDSPHFLSFILMMIVCYDIQKMNGDRRLIQIFKSFVERVFLPQFKPTDRPFLQWNKFSALLSTDPVSIDEMQTYIEGFSSTRSLSPFEKREQLPIFKKKKEEGNDLGNGEGGSFNPSKTFGGERARMMFPIKNQMDDTAEQKQQYPGYNNLNTRNGDSTKKNSITTPQSILPGLERLCKIFVESQQRIQKIISGASFSPGKYY